MAKSKEATDRWLDGLKAQGKLSDEKLEEIRAALTPEAESYIGESALRQEDYSRLAAQSKAKEKEVGDFQTALAEWKTQAEGEYLAMQTRERATAAEVARLKALATSYDVPESELGKVAPVAVEAPKEKPVDMSQFIQKQEAQDAMINTLKVQNQLLSIAARHQTYFGKPLDDENLVDRAITSGKSVVQEWEDTYKVVEKREEIAVAAAETHDQRIREEERAKVLSELKLPETRPGAPTSPIYDAIKQHVAQTADERTTGLQAALESYNKGTYRIQSSS